MADLQQTVGTVIRHERRERGLTLKELAERAIVSVVYLGEIERGKKYPSPIVLERLAGALEMETPDLLERVADELRGTPVAERVIGFNAPRASVAPARPVAPVGAGGARNMLNTLTGLHGLRLVPITPRGVPSGMPVPDGADAPEVAGILEPRVLPMTGEDAALLHLVRRVGAVA